MNTLNASAQVFIPTNVVEERLMFLESYDIPLTPDVERCAYYGDENEFLDMFDELMMTDCEENIHGFLVSIGAISLSNEDVIDMQNMESLESMEASTEEFKNGERVRPRSIFTNASGPKKCKFGDSCKFFAQGNCKFSHPVKKAKKCKFGRKCKLLAKGRCKFTQH